MSFLQIDNVRLPTTKQAETVYQTAEDVCRAIHAGTYRSNCLIPVRGQFQEILGPAVWVCSCDQVAERKRQDGKLELVFTVLEFLLVIDTARRGMDALKGVIEAKRQFGGVIEEGG